MAGPNRRSSTTDRRASTRLSIQQDDDDNYDLEAMGISDGFRPSGGTTGHNRMSSQSSQQPSGRRTPPPRPSSTTKPRYDSFALRHDGAMGPLPSRNPTNASSSISAPLTRSSSVSTEMPYVRSESPYQGPVGPSHPYQMYPQESRLARTASLATTSTAPISERSYIGPSDPTHPYGMYPQNTVPEADNNNDHPAVVPVHVGFPGRTDNYQRRIGPEGEEIGDIIGPDGHTEQLPPYTKYPEGAFARKTLPTVQTAVPGAGGIGLATRNPEFASREDLNTPQSRQSTRSLMSESSEQINPVADGVSEKPALKKWQIIARKKVWNIIPIWAFVLVGAAFVLFAIILGSVLAVLKPKHPPKHHYADDDNDSQYPQSIVITTMTTTFDASPLTAVPSDISALPTGTYVLPITTPSIAPASCLVDSTQNLAWSCGIPPALPYEMSISNIPGSDGLSGNRINLNFGNHSLDFLPYGAQPPVLNIPRDMRLVNDSTYPERGPAWFFQVPYDKIVVVHQDDLLPSSLKRSANIRDDTASFMGRKGVAVPGEMPWICYWNATLLEAFIYVDQASNSAKSAAAAASSKSSASSARTATGTYPSSLPTPSVQPFGYSGLSGDPEFLPCYPKWIKLQERRVPIGGQNPPSPYCIQQDIYEDGTYSPHMDGDLPVTVTLNETVSAIVSPMSGKRVSPASIEERSSSLFNRQLNSMCGCVWLQL